MSNSFYSFLQELVFNLCLYYTCVKETIKKEFIKCAKQKMQRIITAIQLMILLHPFLLHAIQSTNMQLF